MNKLTNIALLSATIGAIGFGYACGDGPTGDTQNATQGTGAGSQGGGTGQGGNAGGVTFITGGGGSGNEGGSCADVVVEADTQIKPADIIFVIDNSGSMGEELQLVEQNINVNFAQIMGASMLDYRIIMVTDHGNDFYDICVAPPLSNTTDCNGPPIENPGRFYHYSVNVQSTDSLCKLLNTMMGPSGGGEADQYGLYPNGWMQHLRTEALKVFVVVTDDSIYCTQGSSTYQDYASIMEGQTAALTWDSDLLALAPAQFGSVANRNYQFYSIIGIPSNPANPDGSYNEFEAVVSGTCPTGVSSGWGYQWLSKGTKVLRFPVCSTTQPGYDVIFQDIAAGVVAGTQVPCEIAIPEPPQGQTLDLNSLSVLYSVGGAGTPEEFTQVPSAGACGVDDDKFYIIDDTIYLCPEACTKITADQMAKVEVKVECGFIQ